MKNLAAEDIYIVNKDDKASYSLVQKLASNFKPGAIIPVTKEEFETMKNGVLRIKNH